MTSGAAATPPPPRLRRRLAQPPPLAALCAALVAASGPKTSGAETFGPVIALLTEPTDEGIPDSPGFAFTFYTRWVEAQGARVVPLRFDAPEEDTDWMLARVNGVLFPGGALNVSNTSRYSQFAERVFHKAVGMRMPLWATCLGFQQVMAASSGEGFPGPVTDGWETFPMWAPLNVTTPEPANASLLAALPQSLKQEAALMPWTWHVHYWSVSVEDFNRRPALQRFWQVLATNVDGRGVEFVSLAQARDGLPVFGAQFHPEKNALDYETPPGAAESGALPVHSSGAIELSNALAKFFVDQARAFRGYGFKDGEIWRSSILNWPVRSSQTVNGLGWAGPLSQVYYFRHGRLRGGRQKRAALLSSA